MKTDLEKKFEKNIPKLKARENTSLTHYTKKVFDRDRFIKLAKKLQEYEQARNEEIFREHLTGNPS